MKPCLISIVIPVYNPPIGLLNRCIDSIVTQDIDEIELILVDDGSTLECASWLDELYKKYSCISIIHQENKGVSVARNVGLQNCNGKYVIFVDADDILAKGWLKKSVNLAEQYSADIVIGRIKMCSIEQVESEEGSLILDSWRVFDENEIWQLQRDTLYEKTDLIHGLAYIDAGACAKLYLGSLLKGAEFPAGIKLSEDQVFNHFVINRSKKCALTNYVSYYYISNSSSASHSIHRDAVEVMCDALERIKKSLFENKEVKEAYYYHVMRDIQKAIQFSLFDKKAGLSFCEKYKGVKKAFGEKLVVEARKNEIGCPFPASKSERISMYLIKHNFPFLYTVLKMIHRRACGKNA